MAVITSEITSYVVLRHGNPRSEDGGMRACIHGFNGSRIVVNCMFWNNEGTMPVNQQIPGQETVHLYYPISAFAEVLNLFQNEKPLYFVFYDTNGKGYIRTNSEPVGEEEGEGSLLHGSG